MWVINVVKILINVCCQMSPSVGFAVMRSCECIRTYRRWQKTIGLENLPVDTADMFALLGMFVYASPGDWLLLGDCINDSEQTDLRTWEL